MKWLYKRKSLLGTCHKINALTMCVVMLWYLGDSAGTASSRVSLSSETGKDSAMSMHFRYKHTSPELTPPQPPLSDSHIQTGRASMPHSLLTLLTPASPKPAYPDLPFPFWRSYSEVSCPLSHPAVTGSWPTDPGASPISILGFIFFFFLAAPGMSCGMWDLQSLLWHAGSFFFFLFQLWHATISLIWDWTRQAPCTGSMEP